MKWISLLLILTLMSGCGFQGLMPETYDGERIEKDEKAIEVYAEENRITSEDLATVYPFIDSNDLYGDPLGNRGERTSVEPGEYTVGEDIEPGRYTIAMADQNAAAAVVVADNDAQRIMELSLGSLNQTAVLDLREGYMLAFKTRSGTLNLEPAEAESIQPDPNGNFQLTAGTHIAGRDMEAGEYVLLSEELPLMNEAGEHRIYWNPNPILPETEAFELSEADRIIIELDENDMIVSGYPITLRKE